MATDWRLLYEKYPGQWVALAEDEQTVVASASTLKEARQKARAAGSQHPIMTKMPSHLSYFAGEA